MSLADDLQKLHELREKGALTEDEYVLAKKRLIDGEPFRFAPKIEKPKPPASDSSLNQFKRSLTDRWIGGVCGGIARSTGVESWIWRLLFALLLLFGGAGLLLYLLLWIFMPSE